MSQRWDKWIAHLMIRAGLLSMMERLEAQRANVLRILAYHRIGRLDDGKVKLDPSLVNATPEMFTQQMNFLKEHYHIVSIDELLSALASHRPLPPRSVMITFDDGYRDFMDRAWPVLENLHIPVILFVATDYLSEGRLFWWDRLYQGIFQTERKELHIPSVGDWSWQNAGQRTRAFVEVKEQLKKINHRRATRLVEEILETLAVSPETSGALLTWQDLRRLYSSGLCVGAHTRSHPILSRLTLDEARQEIVGSQQDLHRELGQTWPIFAYPSGHLADLRSGLVAVLRQAGFQVATTMIEGHNVLGCTPPLRLKRVGMAPHLSMEEFRLVLTGIYNVYGTLINLRTCAR